MMEVVSVTTEQIKESELSAEYMAQLEQIKVFMTRVENTDHKFGELDVYTGGVSAVNTIDTIAACVYQDNSKPIIFLANSRVLTTYNLNKKEIRAIMYHEHAHYSLGHIGLDTRTPKTFEEYVAQESATDLHGIELAVKDGIAKDKIAFTLALSLAKMAASIIQYAFTRKVKINMQALEALDERVEILKKLFIRTEYEHEMIEFQKKTVRTIARIAHKVHGVTSVEGINEIYKSME